MLLRFSTLNYKRKLLRVLLIVLLFFTSNNLAWAELISGFTAGEENVRETTFDDRPFCEKNGGVWREFGDICANSCRSKAQESQCSSQIVYTCDCGPDRCFDNQTCVKFSEFKKAYDKILEAENKERADEEHWMAEFAAKSAQMAAQSKVVYSAPVAPASPEASQLPELVLPQIKDALKEGASAADQALQSKQSAPAPMDTSVPPSFQRRQQKAAGVTQPGNAEQNQTANSVQAPAPGVTQNQAKGQQAVPAQQRINTQTPSAAWGATVTQTSPPTSGAMILNQPAPLAVPQLPSATSSPAPAALPTLPPI